MKSKFPKGQFLKYVDKMIMSVLMDSEHTEPLLCALHNLRLICHEIADQGGYPSGTKLDIEIDRGDHVGEVTFFITRKNFGRARAIEVALAGERYAEPSCFRRMVREMIVTATAIRESDCPQN